MMLLCLYHRFYHHQVSNGVSPTTTEWSSDSVSSTYLRGMQERRSVWATISSPSWKCVTTTAILRTLP